MLSLKPKFGSFCPENTQIVVIIEVTTEILIILIRKYQSDDKF